MSSTVANLPSGAPAADTDIVYTVKDPSGTPSDAKLALSDIKDYVLSGGGGGGAVGPTGAIQLSDGAGNPAYIQNALITEESIDDISLWIGSRLTGVGPYSRAILNKSSGYYAEVGVESNDYTTYRSISGIYALENTAGGILYFTTTDLAENKTSYARIKPSPDIASEYNFTLTLPNSAGTSGQVLSTDGTGILSWVNNAAGPAGAVQFSDGSGGISSSDYIIASDDGAGVQRLNVGDEAAVQFTGLFKVATGSGFFADFSDTDASGYHSYVDVYAPKAEFSPRISLEGIKANSPTDITGIVRFKIPEPATSAGNYFYTLTLPDSPGTSGQVLSTDGTGVLSWVDPAGGTAPATASSTGRAGEIRYDSSYVYVCVATNTWKRAALSTW